MTEVNEVVDVDVPTQGQEGEQQEVGLSYGDIKACVQIIDVTCNRGAIRGDELVQVGTVRDRLVSFLQYAKDQGEDVGELPEVPPSASAPAAE